MLMPDRAPPTILDTHVWIWLVEGVAGALASSAVDEIERAARDGAVLVSAISVWEVAMLEARGRLSLSRPVEKWIEAALNVPGVRLLPLEPEIAVESTRLPGGSHGDPTDRILMASARHLGGRLATRDGAILEYARLGHLEVLDCGN